MLHAVSIANLPKQKHRLHFLPSLSSGSSQNTLWHSHHSQALSVMFIMWATAFSKIMAFNCVLKHTNTHTNHGGILSDCGVHQYMQFGFMRWLEIQFFSNLIRGIQSAHFRAIFEKCVIFVFVFACAMWQISN